MATSKRISIEEIVDYFDELEDPRTNINVKHPLVSVVVIAFVAGLLSERVDCVVLWQALNAATSTMGKNGK